MFNIMLTSFFSNSIPPKCLLQKDKPEYQLANCEMLCILGGGLQRDPPLGPSCHCRCVPSGTGPTLAPYYHCRGTIIIGSRTRNENSNALFHFRSVVFALPTITFTVAHGRTTTGTSWGTPEGRAPHIKSFIWSFPNNELSRVDLYLFPEFFPTFEKFQFYSGPLKIRFNRPLHSSIF